MEQVKLDPSSRKHVGKYSLGMRQRLGIAQAIMERPRYLILDEPMNGLDTQGMEDVRELLQKQKETGVTVILASHSMEDIRLLCDTVHRLFNKKYSHLAFRPCDCNWNYAGHAMGEKSANARWLLHPIFNNQAMHTLELSDVVCDQDHIFRSGVRGDQHI